jgi:hypothetical protein
MISDRLGITSVPRTFVLAKVIALISDHNLQVTASPTAQVTSTHLKITGDSLDDFLQ